MNKSTALQSEVYQKLKQQAESVVPKPAHTSVETKVLFLNWMKKCNKS